MNDLYDPLGEISNPLKSLSIYNHPRFLQAVIGFLFIGFVTLLVLMSAGCRTWQDAAGKSLASASVSVDAAMKGWALWVASGHATPQQEDAVRDALKKYQSAMLVAEDVYAAAIKSKDKNLMQTALAVVAQSRYDFVSLVKTFTQAKATP
jgi:hypothetical protein